MSEHTRFSKRSFGTEQLKIKSVGRVAAEAEESSFSSVSPSIVLQHYLGISWNNDSGMPCSLYGMHPLLSWMSEVLKHDSVAD